MNMEGLKSFLKKEIFCLVLGIYFLKKAQKIYSEMIITIAIGAIGLKFFACLYFVQKKNETK